MEVWSLLSAEGNRESLVSLHTRSNNCPLPIRLGRSSPPPLAERGRMPTTVEIMAGSVIGGEPRVGSGREALVQPSDGVGCAGGGGGQEHKDKPN